MLRRLATEGESYREIARRLGRGQYGVQNRGAMLHKGQWPETLPARRLSGCQRAAYSSSRGWWYFKTTTGGAVRYCTPGKRPVTGARRVLRTAPGKGKRHRSGADFPHGAFKSDP